MTEFHHRSVVNSHNGCYDSRVASGFSLLPPGPDYGRLGIRLASERALLDVTKGFQTLNRRFVEFLAAQILRRHGRDPFGQPVFQRFNLGDV